MDRFVSAVRLAKSVLSKKRTTTAIVSLDEFVAVTEELCSDLEALSESSEPSPKALDPVRTNLELVTQALEVESKAPLRQRPCAAHFFASLPYACAVQRLCDLGSRVDASAWGARCLALQSVGALLRACGPSVAVLPHLHVHLPLCHLLRATAKHVDARLYANAADNEPFNEVDDMEQAALASLVLELWQRPDRGDYFLVEDSALRFPPQFDLVSSVAPLLFRASNDANIGHFAQASLLHAVQLHHKRVDLFVVHHSGVCGLLAGALTSSFEVLPRDLAPFHVDAANEQDSSRRLSNSSGTVTGLKVAFEGFMERWTFCDAMLHASWTARDATSWVSSQRPRTRSRAGSFGRRCSTLETLVNANSLGRGYETASTFIALLEAVTNGFVLASLRRQLLGAGLQISNQRESLSSAVDESREISSGARRRSCSSSGDSIEAAAEKAAVAAQTFLAWGLSEHHVRSDSNSSRHEGWRDVIQEPSDDSSRPPSRLLATATAHALVSGDGGAELCAVLVQRLTKGKTIYNTTREANEQASKKTTEGTAQQQDVENNTTSASLSAGELLLQLLRLCAGGPELFDLCLGHNWERRVAALNTAKSEVGCGRSDGAGDVEGNSEDHNVNNNNDNDSNLDHGTTCVDHNGDSSLDASLKSRRSCSYPIEDAPGWFAAAFPGSAIARWTCVEFGPNSPVKPNSGAAVGAPDGAYGESVEKYLEAAEEEQVRRMLSEQQHDHQIPRRRRRCYYCSSSSCESEDGRSSNSSSGEPVVSSLGLVKGVAARVRDVLSLQREDGSDDSRSAPVPLEEALAVTGLVAELAQAAAAAAAVAAVSSADAELTKGSKGSSRSSNKSKSPSASNSAAEVHLGNSCCGGNLEAQGARALHAAVFGHFAPTSSSAAAPVPPLNDHDTNRNNDHGESVCAALAACWHQVSKAVHGIFDSRRKLADLRSHLGIMKPKKINAASRHETASTSVKSPLSSSYDNDGNASLVLPDGPEGRALTLYVILDECVKEVFGILSAGVLLQSQFKPSTVLTESSAPIRRSDAPSSNTANTIASPVGVGGLNDPVAPSGGGADAFAADDGDEEEEAIGFGSFDPNELENLFARFMPEEPFFFDASSLDNGVFDESTVGRYENIAISVTSAEVPSGEGHDSFGFGNS